MIMPIVKLHSIKLSFSFFLVIVTLIFNGCIKEEQEGELIWPGIDYVVYPDLKPDLLWSKFVEGTEEFVHMNFYVVGLFDDKLIFRPYNFASKIIAIDALSGQELWQSVNDEFTSLYGSGWFVQDANVLYYLKSGNDYLLLIDLETGSLIERRQLPGRIPRTNSQLESIFKDGVLYLKDHAQPSSSPQINYGIKLFAYQLLTGTYQQILEIPASEITVYKRCFIVDHQNKLVYWYATDVAVGTSNERLYRFDLENQTFNLVFDTPLNLAASVLGNIYRYNNYLIINTFNQTRCFDLQTLENKWTLNGTWRSKIHNGQHFLVSDRVVLFSIPFVQDRLAGDILQVNMHTGEIEKYIETRLKNPNDRTFLSEKSLTLTHLPVQESPDHNAYGTISTVNDLHSGEVLMLFHLREYLPTIDRYLHSTAYFNSRGDYVLTDGLSFYAFSSPF